MGFDIRLEDERGAALDTVGDPQDLLVRLLPQPQDESFSCLRFVDPYGDTTFNQAQMATVVEELGRLHAIATTPHERELLDAIRELARRCQSEPHLYMKFYGD